MTYGPSEIDQSNTTAGVYWALNSGTTDNTQGGQSFTAGKTGKLDKVILYLKKNGSPTGLITLKLFATDGGSPTGSVLSTSDTFDVSTGNAAGAEVPIEFPDDYVITAGTVYWITVETTTAYSGANFTSINEDNSTNPYAGGTANRANNVGSWLDDQTGNDYYFKTYILPQLGGTNQFAGYLEV